MPNKNEYCVRIENVTLENFKNVTKGNVFFNEYTKITRKQLSEDDFSNILGIYGQNASGKTSVIAALTLVRQLICGGALNSFARFDIKKGEDKFRVTVDFLVKNNIRYCWVTYSFAVFSNETTMMISEEKIEMSDYKKDESKFNNKTKPYVYSSKTGINSAFLNNISDTQTRTIIQYLSKNDSVLEYNENVSNGRGDKGVVFSTLFNEKVLALIENEKNLTGFNELIHALKDFCAKKFLIVNTSMYSDISHGIVGINGFDLDENDEKIHRNFSALFGRQTMNELQFKAFEKMLINDDVILQALVPGLKIAPHKYRDVLDNNGEKAVEFEVMSIRNGKEIPLFYESRGIKQLLIFLGDLIEVFNEEGTFIAIDEIDSGIFEYLLGELIYTFDNFAQGQLLFTSHNFRVLEKIKANEIFFTVLNDNDKYVRPTNIRPSNNLRNVYYRLIAQGDKNNKYYQKTTSTDIAMSFYKMKEAKLND